MKQFLLLFFTFLSIFCIAQSDVTFTVDMTGEDSTGGVYISGSLNGWSGTSNPLTDNGDGTWSGTLSLDDGYYEYKFTVNDWTSQEAFTQGDVCTTTNFGNTNRTIVVNGPTTVDTAAWGVCSESTTNPGPHDLTINVDMSSYTGSLVGKTVYASGEFNGWSGTSNPLTDNGDGTWSATMSLNEKMYQYKITINDWAEQEDFNAFTNGNQHIAASDGGKNRYVQLSSDMTVQMTWNNSESTTLSVSEFSNSSFYLYPNPATSSVSINSISKVEKVTIFDMNGKEVFKKDINSSGFDLNLSLHSGMYLVRIDTDVNSGYKRLLIK